MDFSELRRDRQSAATTAEEPRSQRRRIPYLDWLRIVSLLGVFVFHAVHPFDTFEWHIKNQDQSETLSLILAFLFPWGLGLFFMIAGAGAFLSLNIRGTEEVLKRAR